MDGTGKEVELRLTRCPKLKRASSSMQRVGKRDGRKGGKSLDNTVEARAFIDCEANEAERVSAD